VRTFDRKAWKSATALLIACATSNGQCTPGWQPLPAGVHPSNWVYALQSWDPDGPGGQRPLLVIGGTFGWVGERSARYLASWDGVEARQFAGGMSPSSVFSLLSATPKWTGGESVLFVGGSFHQAGTVPSRAMAMLSPAGWTAMPGLGTSTASPVRPRIDTMAVLGNDLFVSGNFDRVYGQPTSGMARWDGQMWHPIANGLWVWSLHVHNGQMYGATYHEISPGHRAGILRWTGQGWATVGTNYPESCHALITYRGMLICGGWDIHQSPPWNHIAAWNGSTWLQLGQGLDGPVRALAVFDPDGPGPIPELLIAGGGFSTAGGQPSPGIAAWDGQQWISMGPGTDGGVRALAVYENQLYLGGSFSMAGGISSPHLARWGCPQPPPPPTCYANCDHSTAHPVLNVDDFTCFINRFAAASALTPLQQIGDYANCDESTTPPVLNVDDFTCFINRFAAGCS
jgi:hypothetical protein